MNITFLSSGRDERIVLIKFQIRVNNITTLLDGRVIYLSVSPDIQVFVHHSLVRLEPRIV